MRPLVYTLPHAIAFWLVFVWAFAPEFGIIRGARKRAAETRSPDAGSLRVILLSMNVASLGAFTIAVVRAWQFPAAALPVAFWGGQAILVAGSLLRRHCWRMLGEHFTGDVRAAADQPVVTRGAYGFVRHPSYSGALVMYAGIGIALGSWASTLLLLGVAIPAYDYRMRVEERALVAAIGEPYRSYMRTRRRIVPYVY